MVSQFSGSVHAISQSPSQTRKISCQICAAQGFFERELLFARRPRFRKTRCRYGSPPRPRRLPLGPRTNPRHSSHLPHRGSLRSPRRSRLHRRREVCRRTWRSTSSGPFPRPDRSRRKALFHHRRHPRNPRQNGSPPPSRLRHHHRQNRR